MANSLQELEAFAKGFASTAQEDVEREINPEATGGLEDFVAELESPTAAVEAPPVDPSSPRPPEGSLMSFVDAGTLQPGDVPEFPREEPSNLVGIVDRMIASTGTEAGKARVLKQQFGDRIRVTEKGISVLEDDGKWSRFDPPPTTTGWDLSEIAADTGELIAGDLLPAIGATIGGAVTKTPSGVAGGQVAGRWLQNQTLGRLFGTYDSTLDDMATDLLLEGALTYAAAKVIPGATERVKSVSKDILQKARNITPALVSDAFNEISKRGGGMAKGLLQTIAKKSGQNAIAQESITNPVIVEQANRILTSHTGTLPLPGALGRPGGATAKQVYDSLEQGVINKGRNAIKSVWKVFTNEMGKRERAFIRAVPNNWKADGSKLASDMVSDLAAPAAESGGALLAVTQSTSGKNVFSVPTAKQLAGALGISPVEARNLVRPLSILASRANNLTAKGQLSGKAGAAELLQFRRLYDDALTTLTKTMRGAGRQAPGGIRSSAFEGRKLIVDAFSEKNAGNAANTAYRNMNSWWSDNVGAVRQVTSRLEETAAGKSKASSFLAWMKSALADREFNGQGAELKQAFNILKASPAGRAVVNQFEAANLARETYRAIPHFRAEIALDAVKTGGASLLGASPRLAARFWAPVLTGQAIPQSAIPSLLASGVAPDDLQKIQGIKQWRDMLILAPPEQSAALKQNPEATVGALMDVLGDDNAR